jgi:hypothetical protein
MIEVFIDALVGVLEGKPQVCKIVNRNHGLEPELRIVKILPGDEDTSPNHQRFVPTDRSAGKNADAVDSRRPRVQSRIAVPAAEITLHVTRDKWFHDIKDRRSCL